ncbi:hypothetical protein DFP72DRAFT_1077595 [Ephemerocybe angulata]|uniref:Uncharacterized protein n=1 Tax=Ephemerocybe angulata TaxID=980116 RepID=A0A8H6LY09_9AGAR|nr:hypothetical protein DFP72DRAFT_1077595 [Tulosesus angulatus]
MHGSSNELALHHYSLHLDFSLLTKIYRVGTFHDFKRPSSQPKTAPAHPTPLAGIISVASAQTHDATSTPRALVLQPRARIHKSRHSWYSTINSTPKLVRRIHFYRVGANAGVIRLHSPFKFPKSLNPIVISITEISRHPFRRIRVTPFSGIIYVVTSRSWYHNAGAALDDDGTLVRCRNYSVVPCNNRHRTHDHDPRQELSIILGRIYDFKVSWHAQQRLLTHLVSGDLRLFSLTCLDIGIARCASRHMPALRGYPKYKGLLGHPGAGLYAIRPRGQSDAICPHFRSKSNIPSIS